MTGTILYENGMRALFRAVKGTVPLGGLEITGPKGVFRIGGDDRTAELTVQEGIRGRSVAHDDSPGAVPSPRHGGGLPGADRHHRARRGEYFFPSPRADGAADIVGGSWSRISRGDGWWGCRGRRRFTAEGAGSAEGELGAGC